MWAKYYLSLNKDNIAVIKYDETHPDYARLIDRNEDGGVSLKELQDGKGRLSASLMQEGKDYLADLQQTFDDFEASPWGKLYAQARQIDDVVNHLADSSLTGLYAWQDTEGWSTAGSFARSTDALLDLDFDYGEFHKLLMTETTYHIDPKGTHPTRYWRESFLFYAEEQAQKLERYLDQSGLRSSQTLVVVEGAVSNGTETFVYVTPKDNPDFADHDGDGNTPSRLQYRDFMQFGDYSEKVDFEATWDATKVTSWPISGECDPSSSSADLENSLNAFAEAINQLTGSDLTTVRHVEASFLE